MSFIMYLLLSISNMGLKIISTKDSLNFMREGLNLSKKSNKAKKAN